MAEDKFEQAKGNLKETVGMASSILRIVGSLS